MSRWRTGAEPTRAEALEELARELAKRRRLRESMTSFDDQVMREADLRIDRMQCAYDRLASSWLQPRDGKGEHA